MSLLQDLNLKAEAPRIWYQKKARSFKKREEKNTSTSSRL